MNDRLSQSRLIRWMPMFLAAGLFLFVFFLFSPSLSYELVDLDDITYISNNTAVLDGLSASSIRQAFSLDNTTATMYMPLLWVSYMLDIEWLGATPVNPWGFHFTNVVLHALNSVLLFLLLLAFCKTPWRAFFFAAIWALHPLRVESVAWVAERKDVLSGFFALLCIGSYIWAGQQKGAPDGLPSTARRLSIPLNIAALLFFALGLLVKPSLVPIPFILLLLDFWPLRRFELTSRSVRHAALRILLEKTPFFLMAGVAAAGTILTHHAVSGKISVPLLFRLQSIPLSYGFYLFKSLFPHRLTVLYPPYSSWSSPAHAFALFLIATFLLLSFTIFVWHSRQRHPNQMVGWLWFLVWILPVCGLIPIPTNDVADRFSYLPAMGLSVALLFLLPSRQRLHPIWRWIRLGLSTLTLMALSFLTLRQLPVWESTKTLFTRVLAVFPHHPSAIHTLATQLIRDTGNFKEADEIITWALQAHPHHWQILFAKAQCLSELEGPAAAQQLLQEIAPPTSRFTYVDWQRDLARYAHMLGQYEDAIRHANQAMSLLPPHDRSQTHILLLALAAAYEKGDMPLALSYARRYPPYSDKTSLELADLLPHFIFQWAAGYRRDAYSFFQRLAAAYPDRPNILNNVVWALSTASWSPADPQEVLGMAVQLSGLFTTPHPSILDTLAAAQANAGDFDAAIRTMQEALSIFPADANSDLLLFKERLASRMGLYEQGRPYREDAFLRMYATYFGEPTAILPPPP